MLYIAVGVVFASILGYLAYKDFFIPPEQMVKPPEFATSPVQSKKKTDQEKATYTVPPTHPKNLTIKKLDLTANIVPLGTLASGALDAPKTAWDAGWYASSAQPGSGSGAIVLDGHVNDALNQPGIFYALHTLVAGDEIRIQRGDDIVYIYEVRAVQQTLSAALDMSAVMTSIEPTKEGLNIITCGGTYDTTAQTYRDRVVVYATLVS